MSLERPITLFLQSSLFFPQRPQRHQRAAWCDQQCGQRPLDFQDGNSRPWWLLQLSVHLCDGPRNELCRAGPWKSHEAQSVPSRVTPTSQKPATQHLPSWRWARAVTSRYRGLLEASLALKAVAPVGNSFSWRPLWLLQDLLIELLLG